MIVYFSANHRELDHRGMQLQQIENAIRLNGGVLACSWLETARMRIGNVSMPPVSWKDVCFEAEEGICRAAAIIVEASGAVAFGNGYELAFGLAQGKRALALISDEQYDNSYASGLTHTASTVKSYNQANLNEIIRHFMASLEVK